MTSAWVIPVLALGVFLVRLSGLTLGALHLPPFWRRVLSHLPLAVFTALVVSALVGRADEAVERVPAIIGAGLVAARTRQIWLCIVAGLVLYWLARLWLAGV